MSLTDDDKQWIDARLERLAAPLLKEFHDNPAAMVMDAKLLVLSVRVISAELKSSMEYLERHIDHKIDAGFERMELLLKLHEAEHHGKQ